jgi:hypothetical protein
LLGQIDPRRMVAPTYRCHCPRGLLLSSGRSAGPIDAASPAAMYDTGHAVDGASSMDLLTGATFLLLVAQARAVCP